MEKLNEAFFKFVEENIDADPQKLLLSFHGKNLEFPLDLAILQIEARKKYYAKFRSFISNPDFIFPDSLAPEQATDERIAMFHASLVGTEKRVLDMTAGLGIDSMTMASIDNQVTSIELIPSKADALRHNASALGLENINIICGDSVDFIHKNKEHHHTIFIDPARRDENQRRTYSFADCTPDITTLIPEMLLRCGKILVKASPLLDIDAVLKQLPDVKRIYIVCLKGECKEILVEIARGAAFRGVWTYDFKSDGSIVKFNITPEELEMHQAPILHPDEIHMRGHIYEPNAAMQKITAYGALCKRFPGLKRIAPNTNLYYARRRFKGFPGRTFKVIALPDKKDLKNLKGEERCVATRNYPMEASALRKKLGVKEGDKEFILGFRCGTEDKPIIVEARKL